jgi:hypothetical protein
MKLVLRSKKEKSLSGFAYKLIASMGIVFALSTFSTTLAIALVVLLLTGSLL